MGAPLGDERGAIFSGAFVEPATAPRSSPPQSEHSRCTGATIRLDLVTPAVDDVTDANHGGEITPGGDGRGIQRGQQRFSEAIGPVTAILGGWSALCESRRVRCTEAAG
jgi:hypothetical protein